MVVVAAAVMGLPSEQRTGSTLHRLMRRKQVDDSSRKRGEGQQLAKSLSVFQLIPIGVGSTIGAGVYVLIGTVARERSGPSLTLSFLIAGIAAALSALCYAELSSRCPSAGSAYHYAYICVGEGIAWLIGWALVLEYTVGGSAVARGIAPNLALLVGGEDKFPAWLMRRYIAGTNIEVDPCAGLLVVIVTLLLCSGIKESAMVQAAITSANVCVLIFVIVAGAVIGFKSDWPGYRQSHGYLPFGINGMLGGAATVFFAYIGFDTVASTAEEVKNPQRDLPLGIGLSLLICGSLYMLVSSIIVGVVPYYAMDVNTPISAAFSKHGVHWAMYLVTVGAVAALSSTLMGSLLPQPRILMAMGRDGLLPAFFVKVNKMTAIPINGTLVTGLVATLMAFTMDLDQLSGMVSFGTLLAFAAVGVSILILRYVPPADAHALTAQDASPASHSLEFPVQQHMGEEADGHSKNPLLTKEANYEEKKHEDRRRQASAMSILAIFIGGVLIAVAASAELLPSWSRWTMGSIGLLAFASGSIVLVLLDQDQGRHTFGHSGGFMCPFVPWLPIASILINVYLLADLGLLTWLSVGVWLVIGVAIYIFYGMRHSLLSEEKGMDIALQC